MRVILAFLLFSQLIVVPGINYEQISPEEFVELLNREYSERLIKVKKESELGIPDSAKVKLYLEEDGKVKVIGIRGVYDKCVFAPREGATVPIEVLYGRENEVSVEIRDGSDIGGVPLEGPNADVVMEMDFPQVINAVLTGKVSKIKVKDSQGMWAEEQHRVRYVLTLKDVVLKGVVRPGEDPYLMFPGRSSVFQDPQYGRRIVVSGGAGSGLTLLIFAEKAGEYLRQELERMYYVNKGLLAAILTSTFLPAGFRAYVHTGQLGWEIPLLPSFLQPYFGGIEMDWGYPLRGLKINMAYFLFNDSPDIWMSITYEMLQSGKTEKAKEEVEKWIGIIFYDLLNEGEELGEYVEQSKEELYEEIFSEMSKVAFFAREVLRKKHLGIAPEVSKFPFDFPENWVEKPKERIWYLFEILHDSVYGE